VRRFQLLDLNSDFVEVISGLFFLIHAKESVCFGENGIFVFVAIELLLNE
jgi:hypothetical protein